MKLRESGLVTQKILEMTSSKAKDAPVPAMQQPTAKKKTRIQTHREELVLDCALDVFAKYGFHGATIDQIASKAELSKPNVLYYFKSKEQIYQALLQRTMTGWLAPFLEISSVGDPIDVLKTYISRKLDMSFDNPLPSRLFAIEVLNGAPQMKGVMKTSLRAIVLEKASVIQGWMNSGKIRPVDPYHLIFSMWSVTQHYADFAVQIECIMGMPPNRDHTKAAVIDILLRGLKP